MHVTWRVAGIPSLRGWRLAKAVGDTIRASSRSHERRRTAFRIIHFSIQSNHLHFIVEALGKVTLEKGLRGLAVWLARRINEELGRHGQVFQGRYHARPLETPTEVRNAIVYVLQNHKHHSPSRYLIDEMSSARWFNGWAQPLPPQANPSPVSFPRTWLARKGWRKHGGPIHFDEAPRS